MRLLTSIVFCLVVLFSSVASSETGGFDVTNYGAIPDDGLTDVAALQAAVDDACASSFDHKIVHLPAGDYDMGDGTGTSFYNDSSIVIDNDLAGGCDNLTIRGAGRDVTRLLAENTNGQVMIAFCNYGTTDCNDTETTATKNIRISDLTFADLDPPLHGGQNSGYAFADAPTGTAPAFGDAVTWTGGSGVLIEYDASHPDGHLYVISEPTNTPNGTLSGDGGNWTTGTITSAAGQRTEGTHGVVTKYVDGVIFERIGCFGLSDECIDLKISSNNVRVRDLYSVDVGQVDEGGAPVSIIDSRNITVDGFYIDMGTRSANGVDETSGIGIATNACGLDLYDTGNPQTSGTPDGLCDSDPSGSAYPIRNIRIQNGTIEDTSTTDPEQARGGIALQTADSDSVIEDVVISDVYVSMPTFGADLGDAFQTSGGSGSIEVTVRDSKFKGGVRSLSNHRITAIETRFEYNGSTSTNAGFSKLINSYLSMTNGTTYTLTNSHPLTMMYSEIDGSGADCVRLTSAGPNYFIGNIFRDCGETVEASPAGAGDHAIDTATGHNNSHVYYNFKIGGNASAGFRVGDGTGQSASSDGTCILTGVGGNSLCLNNFDAL